MHEVSHIAHLLDDGALFGFDAGIDSQPVLEAALTVNTAPVAAQVAGFAQPGAASAALCLITSGEARRVEVRSHGFTSTLCFSWAISHRMWLPCVVALAVRPHIFRQKNSQTRF
jgi:hypothetical protein